MTVGQDIREHQQPASSPGLGWSRVRSLAVHGSSQAAPPASHPLHGWVGKTNDRDPAARRAGRWIYRAIAEQAFGALVPRMVDGRR
jgi:hypothetical protein